MSKARNEKKTKSTLREYAEAIGFVVLLTLVLRTFVMQAFQIPSESMRDTLYVGDFLFISKFEYGPKLPFVDVRLPGFRRPEPGDVIVFKFPQDPRRDMIKRCVAVGGQTVEIRDKALFVDGRRRVEPFAKHIQSLVLPAAQSPRDNFGPYLVPAGHLFMMGDNRDNSADSRYQGPVPMRLVEGRALFLYWSWDGERMWPRFDRVLSAIR
jgi:signal peptidase I